MRMTLTKRILTLMGTPHEWWPVDEIVWSVYDLGRRLPETNEVIRKALRRLELAGKVKCVAIHVNHAKLYRLVP